MSDSGHLRHFDPQAEHPIPPWPGPGPAPVGPERVYVIGVRTIEGRIEFYFVERPDVPDPSRDGPLQIRVPEDCVIVLKLDAGLQWGFRSKNAVMLGPMSYPSVPRYFNLVHSSVDGHCREVRFNARYLDIKQSNADFYALYIVIDQKTGDGAVASPLLLRIDPDISNPGDHH